MGQDVSIVFAAKKVADETLVSAATMAFAEEPPANLVLLISSEGPASVHKTFPEFTAVSLWTDVEEGLDRFAAQLSRTTGLCVVLTMADHACVGAWQVFEDGRPGPGEAVEGDGYLGASIAGIEAAFEVKLQIGKLERLAFTDAFLKKPKGLCVFGSAEGLRPGKAVGAKQVRAILECDLPEAELECLLLVDDA